jgi:hypothetical protein
VIPGLSLPQMMIVWAIGAVVAFVTGSAGTAVVTGWMNRNTAKAAAAKQLADEDVARQDARNREAERFKLIQEVEQKAHDVAAAASELKYDNLEKQCVECITELSRMKNRDRRRDRIEDAMLDAMVEVVPLLHADAPQTAKLRRAISAARQARYELDEDV